MATDRSEIPHGMRRIYLRFVRWRSAHPGVRLPIPPRLWRAAAEVAREHGVCRTAQVLHLLLGVPVCVPQPARDVDSYLGV
jgi:hypothetical protein